MGGMGFPAAASTARIARLPSGGRQWRTSSAGAWLLPGALGRSWLWCRGPAWQGRRGWQGAAWTSRWACAQQWGGDGTRLRESTLLGRGSCPPAAGPRPRSPSHVPCRVPARTA